MTAAYMTRCIYLTFFGEFRGGHAGEVSHGTEDHPVDEDHAAADSGHGVHDDHADHHGDPHESGPRILVPLYILATLAVLAGFTNIPRSGALDRVPAGVALPFGHPFDPTVGTFPTAGPTEGALPPPHFPIR